MKKLSILLLCLCIVVGGEMARASIGAKLDRYAAEIAAKQMDTEGPAAYEMYRRNTEITYIAISLSEATVVGVSACVLVSELKIKKQDKE